MFTFGQSESKLKLAVSGRFTIGTYFNSLENLSANNWSSGPGLHLSLEPYLKIRWKNSFDWSIGVGGYLNEYTFYERNVNVSYDIAFLNLKYESRISKYFEPKKGPFEYISIGGGIGFTPYSHEVNTRTTYEFTAIAATHPQNPLYFSPHIGTYKRDGRFGYSLSLQYTFYQTSTPYFYVDLTTTQSSAQGSHNGNYLGLNIIVDYDLKKKQQPIEEKYPYELPPSYNDREVSGDQLLEIKSKRIKIFIWDHGMIDNDTVSLVLNDHTILENYGLNHTKKKVVVRIDKPQNKLVLHAHNEGSVKPNTAALIIKVGLKKYRFILNSSLDESEQLNIVYKHE